MEERRPYSIKSGRYRSAGGIQEKESVSREKVVARSKKMNLFLNLFDPKRLVAGEKLMDSPESKRL